MMMPTPGKAIEQIPQLDVCVLPIATSDFIQSIQEQDELVSLEAILQFGVGISASRARRSSRLCWREHLLSATYIGHGLETSSKAALVASQQRCFSVVLLPAPQSPLQDYSTDILDQLDARTASWLLRDILRIQAIVISCVLNRINSARELVIERVIGKILDRVQRNRTFVLFAKSLFDFGKIMSPQKPFSAAKTKCLGEFLGRLKPAIRIFAQAASHQVVQLR